MTKYGILYILQQCLLYEVWKSSVCMIEEKHSSINGLNPLLCIPSIYIVMLVFCSTADLYVPYCMQFKVSLFACVCIIYSMTALEFLYSVNVTFFSPISSNCVSCAGQSAEVYRGHLGSYGITGELALRPVASLSGGQKSRLAFSLVTASRYCKVVHMTQLKPMPRACTQWFQGIL